MEDDLPPQLKEYITSVEVKKKLEDESLLLRAYLNVVVESRHILMWDLDIDGKLVHMPYFPGVLSWFEHI